MAVAHYAVMKRSVKEIGKRADQREGRAQRLAMDNVTDTESTEHTSARGPRLQ
jgi:hypothetical protein